MEWSQQEFLFNNSCLITYIIFIVSKFTRFAESFWSFLYGSQKVKTYFTGLAAAYIKNIVVPGAVANTSSSNDDPDDPQHNCMMGKTGTQDDTKRLAVTAITSERGGRGA